MSATRLSIGEVEAKHQKVLAAYTAGADGAAVIFGLLKEYAWLADIPLACDPNAVDSLGNTLLHHAACDNQFHDVIPTLLKWGINPDIANLAGIKPLSLVLNCPTIQAATARILIEYGASPDSPDKNGNTALLLFVEAMRGVQLELSQTTDKQRVTELKIMSNHYQILIIFLLEKHANPNTKNNKQQTAFEILLQIVPFECDLAMMMILDGHSNLNVVNHHRQTIIHLLIEHLGQLHNEIRTIRMSMHQIKTNHKINKIPTAHCQIKALRHKLSLSRKKLNKTKRSIISIAKLNRSLLAIPDGKGRLPLQQLIAQGNFNHEVSSSDDDMPLACQLVALGANQNIFGRNNPYLLFLLLNCKKYTVEFIYQHAMMLIDPPELAARLDILDELGRNPLIILLENRLANSCLIDFKMLISLAALMIKKGANANSCDSLGRNILHMIAEYHPYAMEKFEYVKLFSKLGVDVNAKDARSRTMNAILTARQAALMESHLRVRVTVLKQITSSIESKTRIRFAGSPITFFNRNYSPAPLHVNPSGQNKVIRSILKR